MADSQIKAKYPGLSHFFGAYFHEDWNLDHASANDVIELFLSECNREDVARIVQEITQLEGSSPTEEVLRESIFSLGSYYDVTADNVTFKEWIGRVRKRFSLAYQ